LPDGDGKRAYLNMLTALSLRSTKGVSIDLQWDISNRFLNRPIRFEGMGDRIEQVEINERMVPNMPPEELLCYLCLHGTKHRWVVLDSVCCIAEFVRTRRDINWDYVLEYAKREHCLRVLLLGLFLSKDILEVELPGHIEQLIDRDEGIQDLAAVVYDGLFLGGLDRAVTPGKFDSFMFQVKDSFWDRVRYGCRILFLPTKEDLRGYDLPGFLIYGLRPLRLVVEYGRRRWINHIGHRGGTEGE